MAKIEKQLKEAILALPDKEKDKLLLRLIGKSEVLVEQLFHQLLEDESDLVLRRDDLKDMIETVARGYHESPGWMMMDMRTLSGRISHHVKVTKDKYGEMELNIYMLETFYEHQEKHLKHFNRRSETLGIFVGKRMETILKKIKTLHEDYDIEFQDRINVLLSKIHETCPSVYARQFGIPRQWQR